MDTFKESVLRDRDRHWRARREPPTSLALVCRELKEEPSTGRRAVAVVELIFELLDIAASASEPDEQAYDDFLGGELSAAVRDLSWPEAARERTQRLVTGVAETRRLRLVQASIPILASLMRRVGADWLHRISTDHGARAVRAGALCALAQDYNRSDRETPFLLAARAERDLAGLVRRHALESLVRIRPDHPATLDALVAGANRRVTPGGWVDRLWAIESLGRTWGDNSSVRAVLENLVRDSTDAIRCSALESLALDELGSEKVQGWARVRSPDDEFQVECLCALLHTDNADDEFRELARSILVSGEGTKRRQLLETWSAATPDDPRLLAVLRTLAPRDQDRVMRQSALECVTRSNLEDKVEILGDRALHDAAWHVQLTALRALSHVGGSAARDILRRCLCEDETPSVRQQAAHGLAEVELQSPDIEALMEQARFDDHFEVRFAAVQTVALCCEGNPAARDFLLERSAEDFEWVEDEVEPLDLGEDVRGIALTGLARGWSDDLEVRSWVRSRIEDEESITVRRDALEALASGWPQETETIDLLIGKALEGDIDGRGKAIEILARSWPEENRVRECLMNVVTTETTPGFVGTALKALNFDGSPEGGDAGSAAGNPR